MRSRNVGADADLAAHSVLADWSSDSSRDIFESSQHYEPPKRAGSIDWDADEQCLERLRPYAMRARRNNVSRVHEHTE